MPRQCHLPNARARLRQVTANKAALYVLCASVDELNFADAQARRISVLQYRDKHARADLRVKRAKRLVRAAKRIGALAIINDHPRLAVLTDADGVHVGVNDMSVAAAREIVGSRRIIGASCYASLALAQRAVADGADYIAFGSVFHSPTKPRAPRIALHRLQQYAARLSVPVCAIGGIHGGNIRAVARSGVDLVAVADAAQNGGSLCRLLNNLEN